MESSKLETREKQEIIRSETRSKRKLNRMTPSLPAHIDANAMVLEERANNMNKQYVAYTVRKHFSQTPLT